MNTPKRTRTTNLMDGVDAVPAIVNKTAPVPEIEENDMVDTLLTLCGRCGDNVLRLPIAYQYARQNNCQVDLVFDTYWSNGLVALVRKEDWVHNAWTQEGIVSDVCGGQPWDFGHDWTHEPYEHIYHLGYRLFPEGGCLTTAALNQSGVEIDRTNLYTEACLDYPVAECPHDLAIHVDASHSAHRREAIRDSILERWSDLLRRFANIYIIARAEVRTPEMYDPFFTSDKVRWCEDGGDLSVICSLLGRSVLIGTDSAIWCLARCIKSRAICLVDPDCNVIVPHAQYPFERVQSPKKSSDIIRSVEELLNQ